MLVWLILYLFIMIIPVTAILCGKWFLEKPPKKINSLSGYRTTRSMKSQAAWDFAQQRCGQVWKKLGIYSLPVSTVLFIPAYGKDFATLNIWCLSIVLLQSAALVATIFPVERALKRSFDQCGRRIIK